MQSESVDRFARDLPSSLRIRNWTEADFPAIQELSAAEGWTTPIDRPEAARRAWAASHPALVAEDDRHVVGFLRALTDGGITTYVAELLVAPAWRGQGIGLALLDIAQRLNPGTRVDLLATAASRGYYERQLFREFAGFRRSWGELEE